MNCKNLWGYIIAGTCAGAVTGLFGAGGGMVLVPLLLLLTNTDDDSVFPSSVAIILPICVVSILINLSRISFRASLPYLLGSAIGGTAAGIWGKKIPTVWLHRFLGAMILWGGIRYLCPIF